MVLVSKISGCLSVVSAVCPSCNEDLYGGGAC
jgi:hypothetical protein